MTKRLDNLEVNEISVVDDPGNPGARVELWKRRDAGLFEKARAAVAKLFGKDAIAKLDAELAAASLEPPPAGDPSPTEDPPMADPTPAVTQEAVQKAIADALAVQKAETEALVAKARADAKAEAEADIKKLRDENAALAETVSKAQAEVVRKARVQKIKDTFPALVVDAEKMADVYGALNEDLTKALDATLEAANAAVQKLGLTAEVGSRAPAGGSATEKVAAKAAEIRKARPELTEHQARAEVWKTNPELRAEYNRERREASDTRH